MFLELIFVILLLAFIGFILRKNNFQYKMLKELYPKKFRGINSMYNPLAQFVFLEFGMKTFFWSVAPIYYIRKDWDIAGDEKLKQLNGKLLRNNKYIYFTLGSFLVLFLLTGLASFLS